MYNIKKVVHCAPIKLRLKNWFFGSSTFWIYIVYLQRFLWCGPGCKRDNNQFGSPAYTINEKICTKQNKKKRERENIFGIIVLGLVLHFYPFSYHRKAKFKAFPLKKALNIDQEKG